MRSKGKNIELSINNITVNYSDDGPENAPAIIFIHGFPFNKSMWTMQLEALKDTHRVIAYDVRGHGNSGEGDSEFSMDLFANDLLSLMDALKLDRAILCGLSMGGYIALNAIEKYPERFDGLILSDTQCAADTPEAKEKRLKAIENIRENGVEKYADESIKNLFAIESFATKKNEIAEVREMIVKTSKQSLFNTLIALSKRKETCSGLSNITVPVLIVVGSEDKITPVASAELMHKKIQGSFLNIIAHAGHLTNLENPFEFNQLLINFFAAV